MIALIVHWLILTFVVFITFKLIPGLDAKKNSTYIWVALVYGLIHAIIWGLLGAFLAIISWVTLGLIGWLVNSFILFITDLLVEDFKAKSMGSIFSGALLIWFFSMLLRTLLGL